MGEIVANTIISIFIGCALWALLPRGVALTRRLRVLTEPDAPHQTWELRNDSPLRIRLTRVTYSGIGTYDDRRDRVEERELPILIDRDKLGVDLSFDDEVLEVGRQDRLIKWRKVEVPPGDTLTAFVNLNCTLAIRYRRAGPFGILERRRVSVDGGV